MSQVTAKIIAIRVSFKTDTSPFTLGNGQFNLRTLQSLDSIQSIVIDPPPHNKAYFSDHLKFAQNYFSKELNTTINYDVFPNGESDSYQLSHEMFYYNPNNESLNNERYIELYKEAYELALNDAVIINPDDIVIIFHAGVGNDIYRDFNDTPHDIPSRSILEDEILEFFPNWKASGRSVKGIVLAETVSQYGFELALNGLIVANIGTQLGLLDLINPEKRTTTAGPWGLEDRGLFNANGLLPSVPSAINRIMYLNDPSLMDSIPLTTKLANLNVKSYHSTDLNKSFVKIMMNKNEFYLIENRGRDIYNNDPLKSLDQLIDDFTPEGAFFINYKQILTHNDFSHKNDFTFAASGVLVNAKNFDAAIPHSGLIIWKINQVMLDEKKATNRINDDAFRPAVKIIEADGVFNYNSGGDGFNDERYDAFYAANEASYYQDLINSKSFPNTHSDYEFTESGLVLSNFSSAAEVMNFDYQNNDTYLDLKKGITLSFIDSLESLILYESVDSISIFAINNTPLKIKKAEFHKSKIDASKIHHINSNTVFSAKDKTLNIYNYLTDQNSSILMQQSVDTIFQSENCVYLKTRDELFFFDNLYIPIKISDDIDAIFYFDNSVVVKKASLYYLVKNNNIYELNIHEASDVIKTENGYLALSLYSNHYELNFRNNVLAYDYPKSVFYRQRAGELANLIWKNKSAITIDKENIIKFFNPYQSSNEFQSFYPGEGILDIKYYNSNPGIIKVLTKTGYFQYETSDIRDGQEENYASEHVSTINEKATFLWPNPANNQTSVRVFASVSGICKVKVFNDVGEFIFKDSFNVIKNEAFDYSLNTSEYSNGSYLILIEIAGKTKLMKMAVLH